MSGLSETPAAAAQARAAVPSPVLGPQHHCASSEPSRSSSAQSETGAGDRHGIVKGWASFWTSSICFFDLLLVVLGICAPRAGPDMSSI